MLQFNNNFMIMSLNNFVKHSFFKIVHNLLSIQSRADSNVRRNSTPLNEQLKIFHRRCDSNPRQNQCFVC